MNTIHDKNTYTKYFEELHEKIKEENLHLPTETYGITRIICGILLYILWLILIGKIPLIGVVLYFYLLSVELGFISHDLIHWQYFKKKKLNDFFSYITANLLIWLSRSWWQKKHNVEHHMFTNSDIHDTDIRDYDEIFTKNPWKSAFFHTHKTILFWLATSVLYFNLVFLSYKYIFQNRKYGELILSLSNFALLPYLLYLNYWIVTTIISIAIIYILVWIHLAFVFMTNHIGMEIIDGNTIRSYAWLDLQTRTSRNITWWHFIHEFFGWLNKQIEHHLFPQISRNNTIKVAKIVKEFCKEKWISYHDVSFRKALGEIYHTLKTGETL
jgi:fatty acid desaturase